MGHCVTCVASLLLQRTLRPEPYTLTHPTWHTPLLQKMHIDKGFTLNQSERTFNWMLVSSIISSFVQVNAQYHFFLQTQKRPQRGSKATSTCVSVWTKSHERVQTAVQQTSPSLVQLECTNLDLLS